MTAEADGSREARVRRLEAFAARSLDWPAVLALILPLAPSAIGRRALSELAPRADEDARKALRRAAELQELGEESALPMAGVPDPRPILERCERYRATAGGEDLAAVARFTRVCEDVAHWLAGRREALPESSLLFVGAPDLAPLRAELEAAIDERGNVLPEASPALAGLCRERDELTRRCEQLLREIAQRPGLRGAFADGQGGRPQRRAGRLVLALKARHQSRMHGIVHDRSQSGETIFVEPQELVGIQNRLATVTADAERETSRILSELTRSVAHRRAELDDVLGRLAQLELAVASARFGRSFGGRPARLPGEAGAARGLFLRAWRHPLLVHGSREAGQDPEGRVVPIDVRLGADFDLLVVTGPNTGGKTLALKGAGLAVLMTRLGLAIPCEAGSTVPLYEGVVADIGDEQEIQQNLSTFSSHLARIRAGLKRAGPRTLFLLDELGGGTDPAEGAALGEAILAELLASGAPTMASTHLGKLKEFAFQNARVENAHVEFDLATLGPLYTLVIGAPGESRAIAIARRLGLPEHVVKAAEARLVRTDGEAARLMADMRAVRLEAERLRSEAAGRLAGLEERERELGGRETALVERGERLEAEAQRALEERLARARAWVERARSLLDQLATGPRRTLAEAIAGLDEALDEALLSDRRRSFVAGLSKGDVVWLPRLKKRCQVVRIFKERGELTVRFGKRDMTVSVADVTFYEA